MTCGTITNKYGFTLIEIIVTIVIVASLSGIMIVLISDSLSSSSDTVSRLRKASELSIVMANINDDYYNCPVWTAGTIYALNSFVKPTSWNGYYYICQSCTPPCMSGTSEPPWLSPPPITDNNITWQVRQLSDLQNRINNTNYGRYYNYRDGRYENVIYYVVPPSPVIIPPVPPFTSNILKVTIADSYYSTGDRRSQMLTSYFN